MTLLDTAKYCAKAPRSKKFAHMAKAAIESYELFCAVGQCECENTLCPCKGFGCDRNPDPQAHIAYMGHGTMCDRCCAVMPAEYHLADCKCVTCLEKEDTALRNAFVIEYRGSMNWVDNDKKANVRRRVERCHENDGPQWDDGYDEDTYLG